MNSYPYHTIWLNGRLVSIERVLHSHAEANSDFEHNVFLFIKAWLDDTDEFALQTSGSTGEPKTIHVTRSQMIASARATQQALGLKQDDKALVALDPKFIAGKMMLVRSFVTGMQVYATEPSSNPLHNLPSDLVIDFAAMVPLQVQAVVESNPQLFDRVKICIVGGAAMNKALELQAAACATAFFQSYGMTETISHIALRKIGDNNSDVYTTLPGVSISTDHRDCLVIKVPYVSDEVTTNDVVEIFNSNMFRWIGRWDNIINSGGIKVSPEKLEEEIGQIFTRINFKQPFFISSVEDERLGQRVVLVVESSAPVASSLLPAIHSSIHTFSHHVLPKELYAVAAFSFTKTMKINRRESFVNARLIGRI